MIYNDLCSTFFLGAGPFCAIACAGLFNFVERRRARRSFLSLPSQPFGASLLALPSVGLITWRSFEGSQIANALVVTPEVWAGTFCLLGGLAAFLLLFWLMGAAPASVLTPEKIVAAGTLIAVWALACLARSLFAFLLFLEVGGLLLLLLFFTTPSSSFKKTVSTAQAALTFLWVSIFFLFAVLWAACLSLDTTPSFLADALATTRWFLSPTWAANALPVVFFLKLMVFPWQSALFAFYKQLSLENLLFYNVFYYPAFLFLSLPVFGGVVAALSAGAVWLVSTLVIFSLGALLTSWAAPTDIRAVFAVSSAFNIAFLLCGFFLI